MIVGHVNSQAEPIIRIRVHGRAPQAIELNAIVDTGFNHELTLPLEQVRALQLEYAAPARRTLFSGSSVHIMPPWRNGRIGGSGSWSCLRTC